MKRTNTIILAVISGVATALTMFIAAAVREHIEERQMWLIYQDAQDAFDRRIMGEPEKLDFGRIAEQLDSGVFDE
ncbi:MAG TPA: hypothetical protein PKD55_22440 [Bellilinea sp.]|nr:hypothetical protein [Bellilinea sp.]